MDLIIHIVATRLDLLSPKKTMAQSIWQFDLDPSFCTMITLYRQQRAQQIFLVSSKIFSYLDVSATYVAEGKPKYCERTSV